jgi:hypothetical protein
MLAETVNAPLTAPRVPPVSGILFVEDALDHQFLKPGGCSQ